jgi:hypothetical protein
MMSRATQLVTFVPMRRDGDPAAPFPFNGTIDTVNVRYTT